MSPRRWWGNLDGPAKGVLTIAAFAGVVATTVKACDGVVSASQLSEHVVRQGAVDEAQDEDLELLFQTQVRLVTSVDALQREVREVRMDLRVLDAGRPLPPLRMPDAAPTPEVP